MFPDAPYIARPGNINARERFSRITFPTAGPDHQLPGEKVKVLERVEIRVEPRQRFTRGSRLQFPQTENLSATFK
jgi:hypothetical protein